jgi:hypothetical protein
VQEVVCPAYVVRSDAPVVDDSKFDFFTDLDPRVLCVSMGAVSRFRDVRSRGFAAMDRVLEDGACGAPLLNNEGRVLGLVEGIVPQQRQEQASKVGDEEYKMVAGNAGFVYASELLELVND